MKQESSQENKNKLFIGIFILLASIYLSTFLHELGHLIFAFIFGCKLPYMVFYLPTPIGGTNCYTPLWNKNIPIWQDNVFFAMGPIFVFLVGVLFLLSLNLKFVKNSYVLSLMAYFFSFSAIGNGVLQFFSSIDLSDLVQHGFNPWYFYILGIIGSLLLLYELFILKNFIKKIEPTTKERTANILTRIWIILVILYFGIYFLHPLFF